MTPAEMALSRAARGAGARRARRLDARAAGAERRTLARGGNAVDARRRQASTRARYVAAADRIADGWLDVFALRDVDLGTPPRWNRDPKTGIEAPLAVRQAARLPRPGPGRRHQVPVGAQPPPAPRDAGAGLCAHAASASTSTRSQEHLDSWFLACPYGVGPNWSSALEAAHPPDQLVGGLAALGGIALSKRRTPSSASAGCARSTSTREFVRGWLSRCIPPPTTT